MAKRKTATNQHEVTAMKPKPEKCELVMNPRARKEANRGTDAIAGAFPPGVGRPALRALHAAGYSRVEQLASVTDEALLGLHGMGPKAPGILRAALVKKRSRRTRDGR